MSTESWLHRKRFAVWGLGRSGQAAANLLARRAKDVIASDIRAENELHPQAQKLEASIRVVGGKNIIADADVIVTSPGLRPGLEVFERARARGIPVISEVDLAYDASNAPWVGITGTDGKTTTTSLTGALFEGADHPFVVAGNIGTALCDVVDDIDDDTTVIVELSANQLWSCHHLSVATAAITNIAEDHRDYFDDFSEYPRAKLRLVELQSKTADIVLPLHADDPLEKLGQKYRDRTIYFGVADLDDKALSQAERAVFFDAQGVGRWRDGGRDGVWLESFSDAALMGPHNQLNAACAAAVARTRGIEWDEMGRAVCDFSPLAHRMEPVGKVDGVMFIDDSKATNAHASMAGIKGVSGSLIVIAGGRDKGLDLDQWSRCVARRADHVVIIGEIRERMATTLRQAGADLSHAASLPAAVEQAQTRARPGSTVVLSPACSSYDMFSSYRERGRIFQQAVAALPGFSSAQGDQ